MKEKHSDREKSRQTARWTDSWSKTFRTDQLLQQRQNGFVKLAKKQ